MKKIVVSDTLCIGCGACIAIDSEHFEFSDDGLSQVINQENLESKSLIESIEACPTTAITLEEETKDNVIEVDFNQVSEEAA